ncbi:MAG: hypothetical protein JXB62_11135 [Pirellulales bacterium]|nr:hypothetical protein [Pirellulales bacterium]
MIRKRWLRTLLMLVLGLLVIRLAVYWGCGRPKGLTPPAPSAPKAPGWTAKPTRPSEPPEPPDATQLPFFPADALRDPADDDSPAKYGWPADFKMPSRIVIEDVPEVPERIKGPSPPFEVTE